MHIERQAHFSLCARPSSPAFSSVAIPLLVPTTPPPSPNKMLTLKPNFRVHTGTLSLTQPNPLPDVSSFLTTSIILPPRKLYATLGISLPPPPTCHPTSIFPHPHNWSPRAKWHNTNIRAATNSSYFAAIAAASRSSTQSNGGWNDQN